MSDAPAAPLAGIRVLECGDAVAAAYAGRLLRDLGADVVKVERGAGADLRRRAPFVCGDGPGDGGSSAAFAYFHADKRSVALDDSADLEPLLAAADVVLRAGRPGSTWPDDAAVAAVEGVNEGLVTVDVSSFGVGGPLSGEPGGDLIALAASGMLALTAADPVDPEAPPLRYRGELSSIFAACDAVVAVLGALHARWADGRGQRIDVSAQEAVVSIMATALPSFTYAGVVPERNGRRGVCPWAFYACADGVVLVQCTEDSQWQALVKLLGDPEWGQLEMFATTAQRVELTEAVEPLVAAAMAEVQVEEFLRAAHAAGVPASLVHSAQDVVEWDHLRERGYLQPIAQVERGVARSVLAPTRPYRLHDQPPPGPRTAPCRGEHTREVLAEWAGRRPSAPAGRAAGGAGRPAPADHRGAAGSPPVVPVTAGSPAAPLAGVRVIDMTWVWAGPLATMQLAHLGAEVIKVESSGRVDVTRRLGPFVDEVPGVDRSGYFNQYNQGKHSICLDLTSATGKELLAGLIASADAVVDNMRAGALARMGFPYERLRELNPRIVAVSMTGFGESGPERDRLAYGSIIDALSGVASVTGPVGGGPTDIPMSLPDPCAGLHAAIATLGALYRARTTGVGARVECAMLEAWMSAQPWPVLGYSAEGGQPACVGDRDEAMSPHGVFRCAGGARWVAVAVEDDEQFAALAAAMGRPELATDGCFATLAQRRAGEDELETLVSAWTERQELDAVVAGLRAAGVTAWPVERMDAVVASEHLAARDYFTRSEHPAFGVRPLGGVPWRTSRSPMRASAPAPMLGQHTPEVLRRVLGLSDEVVASLDAAGVLR